MKSILAALIATRTSTPRGFASVCLDQNNYLTQWFGNNVTSTKYDMIWDKDCAS